MPGIDIDKKTPPQSISNSNNNASTSSNNNGITISPTKRAIMNAFANSLSRSLSNGSFSYKSLGKSLSQMSYGRSPLFDIYQQFKQSVPKNSLPPCVEEDDEMLQDIETNFCKDFTCCGMVLKDLHELLQHFEDAHRMESDMEEEDDLPFEFDDLSSNRNNNNENYLPTLTDMFLKDLESKQRNLEENNLLNNGIGMQNQPIQQSVAMSEIYSEDKKLVDPISTLADANSSSAINNNTSFSDILNNKNNSNSTANINNNLNQFAYNLSRHNSSSSNLSAKLNNPMTLNIPNTTMSGTTSQVTTPTSANTSNFNLSKNISAFNSAVSGNVAGNIFNSGTSSQPQTPGLTQPSLPTTPATTTAPTTTTATAIAAVTGASGFQAVNNLKNLQSNKATSSAVPASTVAGGIHPIFPNTAVNPFNLLGNNGKNGVTPFNMMSTTTASTSAMNEDQTQQEFDDMDMDMDMDDSNAAGQGEAGSDEEKKYKCTVPGCNKTYKNPGGLKYHLQHGHFEDTGDPEMDKIMTKPFQCTFENCGKRYKNMNGLKYHIEHTHTALFYNQQGGIGLNGNQPNVPLDSSQVLAFQALQMQQLQQLQHIN